MLTAGFRARTGMWCQRAENPHVTMRWASYAAPCGLHPVGMLTRLLGYPART